MRRALAIYSPPLEPVAVNPHISPTACGGRCGLHAGVREGLPRACECVDEKCGPRPVAGFTLLELMVTVAIIALIVAVAVPAYNGHVRSSREGVLVANIATMEVFQEDYRLRTGSYLKAAANRAEIADAIGWRPKSDKGTAYSISSGVGDAYRVVAVSPDGMRVCVQYPEKARC